MRTKLLLFAVLMLVAANLVVLNAWLNSPSVGDADYVVTTIPTLPEPVSVESRILFGGDVYWGRLFERNAPGDYAFPFSGLSTLNKPDYDAWIVNTECPITDELVAFDLQWEAIQFNCRPEYLSEAAKWFDVVSLANNHTDNVRGEEGLFETRQNLEEAGIQHFGHYEPGVLEDLCEVVTIPARLSIDDGTTQEVELPIAMCGYHGVFRRFTTEEIEHLSQHTEHFITISMPHAGAEYQPSSDQFREEAYRGMIDAGADAVIGNHPHWVQDTEAYEGRLIVYSMGNFIFDQQFNEEVTRSAMIDVTIELKYSEQLQEYLDVAGECVEFKDDCLDQIVALGLTKPEVTFSYGTVATRTTGLVTKLDTAGQAALEQRLDWRRTLIDLENQLTQMQTDVISSAHEQD